MIIKRLTKNENKAISDYISNEIVIEKEKKDIKGVYLISFMDDDDLNNYIDIHIIKDNVGSKDVLVNKSTINNVIIRTYYSSKDNYKDDFSDDVSIAYSYELFNSTIIKDTRDKYYTNIKNKFIEYGYQEYGNKLVFAPLLNISTRKKRTKKDNTIALNK